MSSGQSRLSSGSHVFSALLHRGGKCERGGVTYITNTCKHVGAPPHSLGETLPLEEVLRSSVHHSAADDFVHRELLDDRGLLGLPLLGRLLLPHPAGNDKARGWLFTSTSILQHFRHLKLDTGATMTRYLFIYWFIFGSGVRRDHGTQEGGGSRTMIRALAPAAPPDVDTLLTVSFNPRILTRINACTCTVQKSSM